MAATRGEFSSRFGFIMAAAGSAVGLGNIWGFPTQAASNGGAAFLLVYLLLAFVLAYPALMAELIIGRHAHANTVSALKQISNGPVSARIGATTGIIGFTVASLILSFYAIVAGWMIAYCLGSLFELFGLHGIHAWLIEFSFSRNILFAAVFMLLTVGIISKGVQSGIERWSSRLMPALLLMLVALVVYVLTLPGAMQGLKVYLQPDLSSALQPELIVAALGSAFFSLSLGVGTMLVYGSYINDREHLPKLGGMATLVDVCIAVVAGFLVLPAMYVAAHNGVQIFTESGALLSEDTLIFTVLPALFESMGTAGIVVSSVFFFLMSIAALTSSISMLEVPVAYTVETYNQPRHRVTYLIGGAIFLVSLGILLNFDTLFGFVIALTTRYSQPLLGFMLCVFAGWVWHRNSLLAELQKNDANAEHSLFWRIWPGYVRYVCPLVILGIFAQSLR